jgi:hypothetical protein
LEFAWPKFEVLDCCTYLLGVTCPKFEVRDYYTQLPGHYPFKKFNSKISLHHLQFLHVSQGHFTTIWNGMMPTDSQVFVRIGISMVWALIIGSWGFLPLQFVYRLDVIRQ